MPTITRTLIKTALVYLLVGTLLSMLGLIQLVVPLHPFLAALQPTALHLIVVGWLTQLILGVALLMLPIRSKAQPRGPESVRWCCYALFAGGLVLAMLPDPLQSLRPVPSLGCLLVLSATL